ncbi:MAG TPA: YlxR family protein [Mollicutes bacterium]|nr:YlxR family protein [Mollicutes bacterium]
MKKVPLRLCVVTREKHPKKDLIRIVKYKDNIDIDVTGKQNGKGCYLKKDKTVIEKAKQTKILNRVFETNVNDDIYDKILEII